MMSEFNTSKIAKFCDIAVKARIIYLAGTVEYLHNKVFYCVDTPP